MRASDFELGASLPINTFRLEDEAETLRAGAVTPKEGAT